MRATPLFVSVLFIGLDLNAQNPPPPPTNLNDQSPNPNAPIDGGLIGLLAAGAGVGYKKYKQKKEVE